MPLAAEGTRGPFEVTLQPHCKTELERRCAELPRARDVYDGILWRITRDPRCGMRLSLKFPSRPEAEVWMVKTKAGLLPTVVLTLLIEGQSVTVVALKISERDLVL